MNNWQEITRPQKPLAQTFPECALTDLSHFGLIRISGADSREFLQGQLTNDINAVTPALAQFSSYCNPKGRMLGSFWIFQRDEDLYLQLPAGLLESVLKRLRMFVLRSDASLHDASAELARFGISGDCSADLLPFAPGDAKACQTRDQVTVIRLPGDRPRFELIGPPEILAQTWRRLLDSAEQAGPDFWSLMDIRAGMPTVFEDTIEAFVPQMANLQLIGGISFTKGCYTGQEVVARMQYLGKLKRRMYHAHVDTTQAPVRGTEVFSPSSESAQGAGRVVDVAASPQGGYELLAVVQISSAETDDLHIGDADGPRLSLLDLPYPFDTAEG
jgi:folate-binding protein YgfZ